MKKIFNLMMIALVAMVGFASCSEDCDHDFIEHDYSKDLVGTWTCLNENLAEALVFKADGSFVSSGVADGQYWEDVDATWELKNNKLVLSHAEYKSELLLEIIPGKSLALVDVENGIRNTFEYCENDLSDEIVGMWVCTDGRVDVKDDMMIQTFNEDGSLTYTGYAPLAGGFTLNGEGTYKVIGDLAIINLSKGNLVEDASEYMIKKLIYSPMGTAMGDIITFKGYYNAEEMTLSWLRVKQNLNLTGKVYDYSSAYVTNAKGTDEDFSITGQIFNMADIKAGDFDMMFRSVLFCLEFPNATTIKQHFLVNGYNTGFETPITVEGNKVTLDMSAGNPAYRKVEMYMYQDADDSQLHIYMPTSSFINYFANLEIVTMLTEGKIDLSDAAAIEKVYTHMEERVESINVSFVMKARE